jgi:hypothetical protein
MRTSATGAAIRSRVVMSMTGAVLDGVELSFSAMAHLAYKRARRGWLSGRNVLLAHAAAPKELTAAKRTCHKLANALQKSRRLHLSV